MTKLIIRLKGGEGSGHFGHSGREGLVGGSDPGKGSPMPSWLQGNLEAVAGLSSLKDVNNALKAHLRDNLPKGSVLESASRSGSTMFGIHLTLKPDVGADTIKNVVGDFLSKNAPGWGISDITLHNIVGKWEDVNTVYITSKGRITGDIKVTNLLP